MFSTGKSPCMRRLIWLAAQLTVRFLCILAFRVRVFGQLNIPREGGLLVVANHQSYLDPILLGLGDGHRTMNYMARRSLFRNPLFGKAISLVNTFPVSRGGRDLAAMREAVSRLRNGACLAVFPEGTRSRNGEIGVMHHGVLAIAERAKAAVLPVVIEGAYEAWPRGQRPRSRPIMVMYGQPIPAEVCRSMGREKLMARLREEMVELRATLRERMNCARDGC